MANLTLLDWAKRLDPDGSVPIIANILSQTNEILTDCVVVKGNLPTGHRSTIATGLPTVYYRALNQGIATSKSTTVQVDEACAIAEARSEIDIDLAMLNGNTAEFRLTEARQFIEAMNQTIATGLFYGNPATDPKQFLGFSQRYSDTTAGNAQNLILSDGNVALQQTSVWLVCWSDNTVFCPFPKGSTAGLLHEDLGRQTSYDVGGVAGQRMEVYADRYQWKTGLVVKDWRAVVRIANLETADFADLGVAASGDLRPSVFTNIIHLMARALTRVPVGIRRTTRPAFYMNASVFAVLMRTALEKSSSALSVQSALDQFGRPSQMLSFLGVPIRQCDAIVNTEAVVA
jgi:hypothetical protein